jgi:Protein of unknown function (DUF2490)
MLRMALCLTPALAVAQESNSDGSIEIGLWKRMSQSDMLYFPLSVTRASEVDHAEALLGAGYDRVLDETFAARLGYRYLWELSPAPGTVPFREHRGVAELFVRKMAGRHLALLDRTRFELRGVDRAAVSWRLRNRIRAGRVVELSHERTLTPYGSFEAGYDSRFNTINRLRFSLGVTAKLSSRFIPDVYVARQRDSRENTGPPMSVGATLNFFL